MDNAKKRPKGPDIGLHQARRDTSKGVKMGTGI
ncbi:hypothetical protein ACVW0W_003145 [Bradyrhizobium sp. USDA 4469]